MRWTAFQFDGRTYDLTHLHPCVKSYMQPASGNNPPRVYRVEVIFSMHCFTRGMEGETPDADLFYCDSRETRHFDFRRYEISHHLPGIVDGLMTRKCFHTERGNYFTIDIFGYRRYEDRIRDLLHSLEIIEGRHRQSLHPERLSQRRRAPQRKAE